MLKNDFDLEKLEKLMNNVDTDFLKLKNVRIISF